MSKHIWLISIAILFQLLVFGQSSAKNISKTSIIQIGQKVPSGMVLGKMLHSKNPSVTFGNFRGKWLVLDFWASWCSPCMTALRTTDSLETEFGRDITFLPVSELRNQKGEDVRKFMEQKNLHFKTVINDVKLAAMFPHHIIPHYVWIDREGVVRAITGMEPVNAKNVRDLLATHSTAGLKTKADRDFNMFVPMFFHGNGGHVDNPVYQTILTDSVEGLPGFISPLRDSLGNLLAFGEMNYELELYFTALTLNRTVTPNAKVIFVEKDGVLQKTPDSLYRMTEWRPWDSLVLGKQYAYSVILPRDRSISDSIFYREIMLNDLNHFFPFYCTIEKKRIPCWVMIRVNDDAESLIQTKSNDSMWYWSSLPGKDTHGGHDVLDSMHHTPFGVMVDFLRSYPFTDPIVDESGISHSFNIDFEIHAKREGDDAWNKPLEIAMVRKALNKYHLDLVNEPRDYDVLILHKR